VTGIMSNPKNADGVLDHRGIREQFVADAMTFVTVPRDMDCWTNTSGFMQRTDESSSYSVADLQ